MTTDRSPGEWSLAVRQQAAVARIGQVGLRSDDLDEMLREVMVLAAETLGAGDLALFEVQPGRRHLRGRAGMRQGQFARRSRMARIELPVGPGSLPGYVVQEGVAVVAPNLLEDPRFRAMAPVHGVDVRAALAALRAHPLGREAARIGVCTDDGQRFVELETGFGGRRVIDWIAGEQLPRIC